MAKLHLIAALGLIVACGGCAKPARVAECDELVALADALAHCSKIPAESRGKIAAVKAKLDELLGQLDRAGGVDNAPQATADNLRKTCRSQRDSVAEAYAQFGPDCIK